MIDKDHYDFLINETLKQGGMAVAEQIKAGAGIEILDQMPDMFRIAWELTRPDAYVRVMDVTDRCRDIDLELWESSGYDGAYLMVAYGEDGNPAVVMGYVHDKGKRTTGTANKRLFDLVSRAHNDEIAAEDIRDKNGVLVTAAGSDMRSTTDLGKKLSGAVRKDIDQQVADFSGQLDDIFGVSPSPGWDPPTPPGGGDSS